MLLSEIQDGSSKMASAKYRLGNISDIVDLELRNYDYYVNISITFHEVKEFNFRTNFANPLFVQPKQNGLNTANP